MTEPLSREQVEWRSVIGFDGLYEVSDNGQVRSLMFPQRGILRKRKQPKILRHRIFKGYHRVSLQKNKKKSTKPVHLIVLEAFKGHRPIGMEGAHLNGIHAHNSISNLAWVTKLENEKHKRLHGTHLEGERHPQAKLTARQVITIRSLRHSGLTATALASHYKVCRATISEICLGNKWKHLIANPA